jgi:Ran GTPase-activating protein (RanGAP) involved in mRNA processing and transport
MSDFGVQLHAKGLKLKGVHFGYNKIGDRGITALAAVLATHPNLRELSLGNTGISSIGLAALSNGIAANSNSALQRLDLRNNELGGGNAGMLLAAILSKDTAALSSLSLVNTGLGDDEVVALAAALHANTVLTRLDLSNNNIGDVGASALIALLENNVVLTLLNLQYNAFGPDMARAWCSGGSVFGWVCLVGCIRPTALLSLSLPPLFFFAPTPPFSDHNFLYDVICEQALAEVVANRNEEAVDQQQQQQQTADGVDGVEGVAEENHSGNTEL